MRVSIVLHNQMTKMRRLGFSIPEISKALKIPKTTVLRHTKNTEIAPENIQRWLNRKNISQLQAEQKWQLAHKKAKKYVLSFKNKELALIGAALYWAEGAKKDFSLTNTDPEIIRIFVQSLTNCFGVSSDDLVISIRIYEDLNKNSCLQYWSEVVGIKLTKNTSFSIVKGSKKGKLKYGMCRVRIKKGGDKLKEILSLKKEVHALVVQRIEQGTPKP